MTFLTVALVSAGATLAGAAISADASRSASHTQADAANRASDMQMAMFERNKADLAPWMQGGQKGLEALLGYSGLGPGGFNPNAPGVRPFGMADFQADPGYRFRMQEGLNALINQRSAIGGLGGTNTQKSLMAYGQGLGAQEYGAAYTRYNQDVSNVFNRLSGISNTGANTAGSIAGLGAAAAGRAGEYGVGGANALAAGQIAGGNAFNQGLSSIGNNYLMAQMLANRAGGAPANPYGGAGGYENYMGYLNTQADPAYGYASPL